MKTVIITGASSGIGRITAEYFSDRGYKVYGVARREFKSDKFTSVKGDVNDYEAMGAVFEDIYKKEGHIDILVNNAGFGIAGAIEDASVESIESIVRTDFTSVTVLCKMIIPYMKKSGGRIINISSVGAIMPLPYQAMYSAVKSAVEVFSRALDTEVRPFGIRVTAILPGDTKTDFTSARVIEDSDANGNKSASMRSIGKMAKDEQNGKDPVTVAKDVFTAATKNDPPLRITVGAISKAEVFLSRVFPLKAINFIIRKMYS